MNEKRALITASAAFAGALLIARPVHILAEDEKPSESNQVEIEEAETSLGSSEADAELTEETAETAGEEGETSAADDAEQTDSAESTLETSEADAELTEETAETADEEIETSAVDNAEQMDSTVESEQFEESADVALTEENMQEEGTIEPAFTGTTGGGSVTAVSQSQGQTVADGEYVITSAANGFKAVDIKNGSTANGGNVQLYDANGTGAQKFQVTWHDSYYSIVNSQSGLSLDVDGNKTANGTNIQQYKANGTTAQQWYILDVGNGFYTILSRNSMKAMDVSCCRTANGTNIQLYDQNGTKAQMFKFLAAGANVSITNGVYEITSALDENKAVDVSCANMNSGANVQLYDANNTDAQKFILTNKGGDAYRVTNLNSGMVLTGTGNVYQSYNTNASSQIWHIRNLGDGTVYFQSSADEVKVLDVAGASTNNGTNVQIHNANATQAQKFHLTKVEYNPVTGEYTLGVSSNSNAKVEVKNGSRKQQANVQVYQNNGTTAQKWYIQDEGNGFVSIKNVKSKHMLDVVGAGTSNGTNVWQYRDNNSLAQMWIEHKNSDGTYTFINAATGKVLDVYAGSTANGTNVQQYQYNGSKAQKFYLEATTGSDNTAIDYSIEIYDIYYNYSVPYYNQADPRWGYRTYGGMNFSSTGCAVTSMASIISGITGQSVTPNQVADYVYANGTFNRGYAGSLQKTVLSAADHWGLKYDVCLDINSLRNALSHGKLVSWSFNAYTGYGNLGATHTVTMSGYNNGNALITDPLFSYRSGWYSLTSLWSWRDTATEDLDLYPVWAFAMYK